MMHYHGKCVTCRDQVYSKYRPETKRSITCSNECRKEWFRKLAKARTGFRGNRAGHLWKGGKHIHLGYQFVHIGTLTPRLQKFAAEMTRGNRNTNGFKYVQEHRIIMADVLNRPLKTYEQVHHKNGNKLDNAPQNLELWIGNHGNAERATDVTCPHCGKTYA